MTISIRICSLWLNWMQTSVHELNLSYLHDDEDDQGDEDVELRVFPGLRVTDVVKLLGDALFGPGPVVQ